jgi:hypothetical protein
MALATLLFCSFSLSILSYGRSEAVHTPSELQCTCDGIAAAISGASQVFFPRMCVMYRLPYRKLISVQAAPEYLSDIHHTSNSSSEVSACSVEPGSAGDVSKIVSHPTLMRQVLLTHIFIAAYPGTKPDTFRSERWRTHYQPGIFLHARSTDLNDTLQRHKGRLWVWNS